MWDLIVSVPDHCLSFYFIFCIMKRAFVLKFIREKIVIIAELAA